MYKNEEEKLSEKLMGEAVMALLNQDAPISNFALMRQLYAMAAAEKKSLRQVALKRAIAEVSHYQNVKRTTSTLEIRDRSNVTHFFTDEGPADGTKKH